MIKIEHAEKAYTTQTVRTLALRDINLHINTGDFVSIMGVSGSGKTTLLNAIGMFEPLDSGQIILAGHDITLLSNSQKITLRRQLLGYIFQSFNLIESMTVYENIALPLKYRGYIKSERRTRVSEALSQFGLSARRSHYPCQLSGGQQQRVAIARAVVSRPKIILADEPTGNLDSKNSRSVLEQLAEINQMGTTIIMVTHSADAAHYATRHLTMQDGHLN